MSEWREVRSVRIRVVSRYFLGTRLRLRASSTQYNHLQRARFALTLSHWQAGKQKMAESITNGTIAGNADVEMKEEAPAEVYYRLSRTKRSTFLFMWRAGISR